MRPHNRIILLSCLLLISMSLVFSCSKPKEGKVIVTEQDFSLRQDNPHAYVMDARGKIKNVGEVDVQNIVVTGFCRSCGDTLAPGRWMVYPEVEKTPEQKAVINYLSKGQETEFSFRGVAFIYNNVAEAPKDKPEKMEVVIKSFETAK